MPSKKFTMTREQAEEVGRVFRKEREARGWTKSQAAEELGVNISMISTLENGFGENTSFTTVLRAVDGYGIPSVRVARALGFVGGPDEVPAHLADIVEDVQTIPVEKLAVLRKCIRDLLVDRA